MITTYGSTRGASTTTTSDASTSGAQTAQWRANANHSTDSAPLDGRDGTDHGTRTDPERRRGMVGHLPMIGLLLGAC